MSDKYPGFLIGFDGIDSSGKETQARKLAERLRYVGWHVHEFVTPDYNTPSGQDLKLRLQGKKGDWHATSWQEKMGYFSTNRAENREKVLQALADGEIVIYDRYIPSSMAFMAVEADLDREEVYAAVQQDEYENHNMPHEDVSVFMDMPPHVAAELLEKRKEKLSDEDEYTDHLEVQERLYAEYDYMTNKYPERFLSVPCVLNEQVVGIDALSEIVWEGLIQRIPALSKTAVNTPGVSSQRLPGGVVGSS